MPGKVLPNRRKELIAPGALFLAAALTVAWAGMGHRYGRHWYLFIFKHKPQGIVIHHTASSGYRNGELLDAEMIDAYHADKGWGVEYKGKTYHIGYHYVILADGSVEPGRPEEVRGAHAPGHNQDLGICLAGHFGEANSDGRMKPSRPTDAQMQALTELVRRLMSKYDLEPDDIHRHGDLGQTACPGERFPFETFVDSLKVGPPSSDASADE